ncbi:hypothetical protein ACFV6E_25040 [Streptomyces sp. NPDC059785]|uniref:hypothetical protein n=1 Tax=unclassified Streptomyces TaxID=2593676 RepID=UPI0036633D65
MFEYELYRTRSADLIREAEGHRRALAAQRHRRTALRAAARGSGRHDGEGRADTRRDRKYRFTRAA